MVEEVGVEPVEHPGVDLLERHAAEGRDDVEADVPAVGLEGRRLDRRADGREPVVDEELAEGLAAWRDVGAAANTDAELVERRLGLGLGPDPAPLGLAPLAVAAGREVDDEPPGAVARIASGHAH
ncbi:MAG: hypothetical protein WAS51_03985 [Ilumatobacteraceae bacterium]